MSVTITIEAPNADSAAYQLAELSAGVTRDSPKREAARRMEAVRQGITAAAGEDIVYEVSALLGEMQIAALCDAAAGPLRLRIDEVATPGSPRSSDASQRYLIVYERAGQARVHTPGVVIWLAILGLLGADHSAQTFEISNAGRSMLARLMSKPAE